MSGLKSNTHNSPDRAESQLQNELRQMFEVDSQQYLQNYLAKAEQLQSQSWKADIQEMYRAIHTIKGGSVTVGADAILAVATALEDLLAQLRYLELAPPLEDGQLSQMLLEAGELLTSSCQIQAVGEEATLAVSPTVERIQVLQEQIQQHYLPNWNEQSILHQEFAEEGFDLVVLDLDMGLEQLSEDKVPEATLNIARRTIEQLREIGQNLQLDSGWNQILGECEALLLQQQDPSVWQTQWTEYCHRLKTCAKEGGKIIESVTAESITTTISTATEETVVSLEQVEDRLSFEIAEEKIVNEQNLIELDSDTLLGLETIFTDLETFEVGSEVTPQPKVQKTPVSAFSRSNAPEKVRETGENEVKIPVPLERLEQTAQNLVEVLLAARSSQGLYQNLQSQLVKLFGWAQDNVNYITRLRQLQDDYALLSNSSNPTDGAIPERYRQGYTTINRLLETSLRLSELGAEAAQLAQATADSLQGLERNLVNLQETVEESRLVPFETLAFRARAILRDLTNRYGKPAQLAVEGAKIELDAGVASKLEPALLHLLRNAYDHGLETAEERIALGKPEQGTIWMSLKRRENQYLLEVRDDGRGINARTIAQMAKTKRFPQTNTQTSDQLLGVLCQPGFSSQSSVSAVSGRGVGMDAIATQVAILNGKLSLETELGTGTAFKLQIPVPHLLVSCILLQVGDRTFAIPTEEVMNTTIFGKLKATPAAEASQVYDWNIFNGTVTVPGLDLLAYWQDSSPSVGRSPEVRLRRTLSETAACVWVTSEDEQQGVWLLADELLGQRDLLIDPLPDPFVSPIGFVGVSLEIDGTLIPVLEATAIAEQILSAPTIPPNQGSFDSLIEASAQEVGSWSNPSGTILVVDDAALMRRRIEVSLGASGYTVQTCADGQEAWNWLQNNPQPALVITDIEMPNMDGFTLINRCRQEGINIPIMVISSRLSEEWSKEAQRLGATDYLTKGFSTAELLTKISNLLNPS